MDERLAGASTAIPAEKISGANGMPEPDLFTWLWRLAPSHQSFTGI